MGHNTLRYYMKIFVKNKKNPLGIRDHWKKNRFTR